MNAVRGEEIFLTTENKVGKLEELTKVIKDSGVNIRAINGYAQGQDACFRLLTSDNAKTKEVLKKIGKIESKEIVIVEMPDEIGELNLLSAKLKNANIDIKHIFGTSSQPKGTAIIVFASNNNTKALEVLSS